MSLIVTYMACSTSGDLILYVLPTSTSGRSMRSCMWITSAVGSSDSAASRATGVAAAALRSEEHTSELQSLMRISYAVFCLKKKIIQHRTITEQQDLDNHQNNQYRVDDTQHKQGECKQIK